MRSAFFLGIDVGTGSARAGIFDLRGRMISAAREPIEIWKPAPDHVEQSSEDIWLACAAATQRALKQAALCPDRIRGIGFDATCSLVALDTDGRQVSVSNSRRRRQNVIVWMDHRAIGQAERINRTRHRVLRYVGGGISPEMQTPKLLWLKENLPDTWRRTARFFDLPDFLTYRATGDDTRSLCTTVCKWTYVGQRGLDGAGWDRSYFQAIGLDDLAREDFRRIGQKIRPMGAPIGRGLTERAARELGLRVGTPVGVAIIDAHAGGLGLLGATVQGQRPTGRSLNHRLAMIGGTSTCHMAVSSQPRFVRGIWGPYYSAMIPGLWLTEGGQSATGALIDHIIYSHAAAAHLQNEAERQSKTIYEVLNARLKVLAEDERTSYPAQLTMDLHIQPDFHGNRSPRANASLRGAISGLQLSATADDLARLYLATIQAVAYGTRHIVEELNAKGYAIDTLFACGGGAKNPVFLREHADVTGCRIILPKEPEAVLLGSAVLGAVAAGAHSSVLAAMTAMNVAGTIITPHHGPVTHYHRAKFSVFHKLHANFVGYRHLMRNFAP